MERQPIDVKDDIYKKDEILKLKVLDRVKKRPFFTIIFYLSNREITVNKDVKKTRDLVEKKRKKGQAMNKYGDRDENLHKNFMEYWYK